MRKCYPNHFDEFKKIIGRNIRHHREKIGWSGAGLGKALGMSAAAISQMENGETDLKISCALLIAELLDTEICNIVGTHTVHSKKEFLKIPPMQEKVLMDTGMVQHLYTEVAVLKQQVKKLSPPPRKRLNFN